MQHIDRLLIGVAVLAAAFGGAILFGLLVAATWVLGIAVPVLVALVLFVAYVIGGWVTE